MSKDLISHGLNLPKLDFTVPKITIPQPPLHQSNPAAWAYTRLKKFIKNFEDKLDNDHEIGARLVSFGTSMTFHIDDIGYYGPDIITFWGKDEKGQELQLIQNISQLSVLLVAVTKQSDPPRRIGFILDEKDKETTEEV